MVGMHVHYAGQVDTQHVKNWKGYEPMAKILADVEKQLNTAHETVEPQQKRSRKPLLLIPVIPLFAVAIAGVVFLKRRGSKKSEW